MLLFRKYAKNKEKNCMNRKQNVGAKSKDKKSHGFSVLLFSLFTFLFSFVLACPNGGPGGLQAPGQKTGTLVSFSVADARTALPPQVSLADVDSYELLGGLSGEAETVLVPSFTGTGTALLVP
jgi:hypothetical protein